MLRILDRSFEELLGAAILAVMALIAVINVFVRYCTNFSFSASEELTVNLFVWVVLLGTARAFREASNFSMNIVYLALPKRLRVALYVFGVVCSVALFGLLFWLGCVEVWDEFDLNVSSESLGIPVWLYTMAVPLFSLLVIFRIFQRALADYRKDMF